MSHLGYCFSTTGSGRPYARNARYYGVSDNACVVLDGTRVVYAGETERFTKVKHDPLKYPEILRLFKTISNLAKNAEFTYINGDDAPNNHHENHMYEVFYQSGFSESAVLVNDGNGNFGECITLAYIQEGNNPVILKKFDMPASPASIYGLFADKIFKEPFAEGKLMGLAAYGHDNSSKYISWNGSSSEIEIATDEEIAEEIQNYMKDSNDVMLARDIAYTVQKNYEETMVNVVKYFKKLLESRDFQTENLCMSGGGILNCPANSKIVGTGLFKNFYASPQPHDGCAESIGRAFRNMEYRGMKLKSKRLEAPFLGIAYPASELLNPHSYLDNWQADILRSLLKGNIIAWCQDGAEYGPRALGHRSFLADPTKKEMADALNRIKGREPWRPLAPIVPDRLFPLIFDVENTDMCEYMLRTLTIKEKWQPKLQAICHVDGTTRPQLLKRDMNSQLYDILMAYFQQTGVPCLVNTSLNINGFPIVETPYDFGCLIDEIGLANGATEAADEKSNQPEVVGIFVEGEDFYKVERLETICE